MPPTPYPIRRRPVIVARERARATPAPEDDATEFRKPNLPPLHGTPSARRQYTYGAAAEPSPARPLLRGDVVDLSGAVQGALKRQELQQAAQHRRQSGADLFLEEAERQERGSVENDEDRQAMPPPSFKPLQKSKEVGSVSLSEHRDDSDGDVARGFDIESDYYSEASIASSPVAAPIVEQHQDSSAVLQRRASKHQPLGYPELPSLSSEVPRRSSNAENEQPSSPSALGTPGLRSSPRRPKQPQPKTVTLDNQKSSETASANARRLREKNPTTKLSITQALLTGQDTMAAQSIVQEKKQFSSRLESGQRAPLRQRSGNSDHVTRDVEESTAARPSLFAQAKDVAVSASPFSTRSFYASDHGEMDDAMQREIQSNESESENGDSRQHWSWLRSLTMLSPFRHNQDDLRTDTINWWQLLNPYTYFEALCWLFSAAHASGLELVNKLCPQTLLDGLFSSLGMVMYFVAAIIGLITLFSVVHATLSGKVDDDFSMDRLLSMPETHWPGLGYMAGKAHGFLPAFSWPTWSQSSSLPDLSHLDNDGLARLDEYLRQYQREFERIQQAGKLHEKSLKKLEAVVPKLVHVQLEDGKPVVAQEFWHALRDLIHRDGDFLTFEQKDGSYEVASEAHWQAIASRITKDPTFTKQINMTVDSMEARIKEGAAGFWDAWIKNNDAKISEMLGSALDQIQNAGSQREFDKRLQRIVKQHIDESNKHSSVVSREEFLRHLKNEFATHRAEVRAELVELQPRLEVLIRQAALLAGKGAPDSMSKAEIVTLVHDLVTKAMADMNLEAMARGQIHSHWDNVLRHQINYFGVGAGATIDAQHTSPPFKPPKDSTYVVQKGLKGVQTPIPRVALEPWSDEGDCWCAARSVNHRGNPHGAILSVQMAHRVIPQHIVVEHIVAAATTDPNARPKEIEVYAEIDPQLRDVVKEFSAKHFPDIYPLGEDNAGWNVSPAALPARFVKIAQFVYEDVQPHDGVQVHKLSDELLDLGAATDHVIVRAVSNYGAKWHTCFYRVRLYGESRDYRGVPW
ncbi:hypothetical protein ACQRIT_004936 [Beauveria bassiana]